MSDGVWWERGARDEGRMVPGPGPGGVRPELVDASREAVRAAVRGRIAGYTPDWTDPDRQDAGVALVRLFGTQAEPVLARVNRLPEKILAEHLATAGVRRRPAGPAAALLEFTVNPPDGASVLVPAGFQAAAPGPDGQVVYETDQDLYATAATVAALVVQQAGTLEPLPLGPAGPGRPFAPFGRDPGPGDGLWIALAGAAAPYPRLSLGLVVVAVPPAPSAARSGGPAAPAAAGPLLRWDVLDGTRFVPADVVRDGTDGLRTDGTVELRVPRSWAPGGPPGLRQGPPLRWLRLRVAHGSFTGSSPVLSGLRLNTVGATAARTVRDEPLQPVRDTSGADRRVMTLSQVPILAGSVVIEVDDDTGGDVFGTSAGPASRWREVESLAACGADDRVFTVDHATGEVAFGDGVHGAAVPQGFRNVRAVRYRVGGGSAGAVAAGAVNAVVTALPFVIGVTNPFPASGGTDAEPDAAAIRRGVGELRARGRAVAPADYGLLATRTPGAAVARARGVPGLHPGFPGVRIPGVVGVLVVPEPAPDADPAAGPGVPTAAALRAVADFLTRTAAPAGVTVVAAPAAYRRVAVEAWVTLDPDLDRSGVLARAGDMVTTHLDPLRGGDDGAGWPFGGALRHTPLVRRLLEVEGVLAVSRLSFTVDGVRLAACADHPIGPDRLVWPERPLLIPVGDPA
ncbi:putative baseplate assembly protein [Streptomyces yaizuensis]|uniref:Baseplate assembly protein n=1 Tax=Streptomyces yaizuensis TaxID=2989713 RepID=A0ABQ5NSL7_9ACTN|nr:putative baseplate assembly protein [Streptomyces sp. YSPA8]GLF93376.1 putative baseplate assembly protein [Streptomyces sp. YSPA8]